MVKGRRRKERLDRLAPPESAPIPGRATLTTKKSSCAMNATAQSTPRIAQRLGSPAPSSLGLKIDMAETLLKQTIGWYNEAWVVLDQRNPVDTLATFMPRATSRGSRRTAAPIQAVGRTLDTLELLAEEDDGVSVLGLAESLGVEKSIASRILASLLDRGYVTRDSINDSYRLSLRVLGLASRFADRIGIPGICQPSIQALSKETEELVQLSIVDGDALVLAAYAQGRHRLSVVPALGTNISLHATASGKAWLASLPEKEAAGIALRHGLVPRTEKTVTELPALLDELARVRGKGYAIAAGEFSEGVNAVAIPVGAERFGAVIGALAVTAPANRLPARPAKRVEAVAALVRETVVELEKLWPIVALSL
jgi:IclR family transcriptional regulator, acetate operon repressor